MGGFGSGRPSGYGKPVVEDYRSLDVNLLHRAGNLRWSSDSKTVSSVNASQLLLSYRVQTGGTDWEDVVENVRIVRAPCRFGGTRPYFICPSVVSGVVCGRRVATLHVAGRFFLCRHCYRLSYTSQSEDSLSRMLRRAGKIRRQLGGEPNMLSLFPPRPKGMWRRSYLRLRKRVFEMEWRAEGAIERRCEEMLARYDKPNPKRGYGT